MQQGTPQPNFELPAPLQQESDFAAAPEHQAAAPERAPAVGGPPLPSQPVAPVAPVPPAPNPVAPPQAQAAIVAAPAVADDNDLIEKEWVIKAKQIVAATHQDPYTQNKELSKFKADYLKKRYNKDIKVEES